MAAYQSLIQSPTHSPTHSPTNTSSLKRTRTDAGFPSAADLPPTAVRISNNLSSDTVVISNTYPYQSYDDSEDDDDTTLVPVCLFDDDIPDYRYEYVMRPITDDMRKEGCRDYPIGFCYTHLQNNTDRTINIQYYRLLHGKTHYVNQEIKPNELIEIPADGSVLEFECIFNHRVICKIWQITPCENMRFLVYNREFALADSIKINNHLLSLSIHI
jgi:hypothetical protein